MLRKAGTAGSEGGRRKRARQLAPRRRPTLPHVRCGRRSEKTGWARAQHRASGRPHPGLIEAMHAADQQAPAMDGPAEPMPRVVGRSPAPARARRPQGADAIAPRGRDKAAREQDLLHRVRAESRAPLAAPPPTDLRRNATQTHASRVAHRSAARHAATPRHGHSHLGKSGGDREPG